MDGCNIDKKRGAWRKGGDTKTRGRVTRRGTKDEGRATRKVTQKNEPDCAGS